MKESSGMLYKFKEIDLKISEINKNKVEST